MENQKGISALIGIIIIVAVVIIVFGGIFGYQYFAMKNNQSQIQSEQQNQNQQQKTENQETNNVQPINQTASWKTYTNNTYKYQINYIPTATIEETMGGGVKIKYQNGSIEICSKLIGACGNFPGVGSEAKRVSKQIIIDGRNYNIAGYILDNNELLGLDLSNNMYSYINISGVQNLDIESKMFEILSTFKFTK